MNKETCTDCHITCHDILNNVGMMTHLLCPLSNIGLDCCEIFFFVFCFFFLSLDKILRTYMYFLL